jgi:hypothetical protein
MKQVCQIPCCSLFRVHRGILSGQNCENYDCWLIGHYRYIWMYGWRTRLVFYYYPVTVSEQILPHIWYFVKLNRITTFKSFLIHNVNKKDWLHVKFIHATFQHFENKMFDSERHYGVFVDTCYFVFKKSSKGSLFAHTYDLYWYA